MAWGENKVRVSVNLSEDQSKYLDRVSAKTPYSRGVIARSAFTQGMSILVEMWSNRKQGSPSWLVDDGASDSDTSR